MLRAYFFLAVILFIGALNRNTIGFVLLFFISFAIADQRLRLEWRWILLYVLSWGAGTAIPYLIQGAGQSRWTISYIFAYNQSMYVLNDPQILMISPFIILGLFGVRKAPRSIRFLIPVALTYIITFFVFGAWMEMRVLIPILPIFVVFLLYNFQNKTQN